MANPDDSIRNFWIEHTKRCRAISEAMGVYQNDPCMMNLWIHDGSKEVPASRIKYRQLLKDSLDEIFATEYKNMKDCIEAKLFGIGLESYTVSNALQRMISRERSSRSSLNTTTWSLSQRIGRLT